MKSRLPVPVRLRVEASGMQPVSSDQPNTHSLEHLQLDGGYAFDQQLHAESAPLSPQHSTSPSSTLRYKHHTGSPVGSDKGSETGATPDHCQADSALFSQLELLNQECQEKEMLINKLSEQLADWEELHAQIQEKDRLNRQYVEALQAAESTISYLTACSLDSQGGFGSLTSPASSDSALYSRCVELHKALQEKEELNKQLIELLNVAERAFSSTDGQEKIPEISALCLKIETALQQGNTCSNRPSLRGVPGGTEGSMQDSVQEALWQQHRLNAELQDQLRAQQRHNNEQDAKCARQQTAAESLYEKQTRGHPCEMGSSDGSLNQETTKVLRSCLSAAESAVASLAAHCANSSFLASGRSSQSSPEVQIHLDTLQRALRERKELGELDQLSANQSPRKKGQLHSELHSNICRLYEVFSDHGQRISELQASLKSERSRKEGGDVLRALPDATSLPPSVQVQLETLHKALREKKKACKSLEEKLATALTSPETARRG